MELLEKITIYYACFNDGSGAVYLKWYLDREQAEIEERDYWSEENQWAEDCTGSVETFVGSDIYKKAKINDARK